MTTSTAVEENVWAGVSTLLTAYADLDERDIVLVAYTYDSRDAAAWVAAALRQRGVTPAMVPMRPLIDEGFEERLRAALPASPGTAGRLIVFTLEQDSMSHFQPLAGLLAMYEPTQCKIIRIISASAEFFTHAMNMTPVELSRRNASLLSRLQHAASLRIRTRGGTDLRVELDATYDWISNRGVWRPGAFTILPAGEIATYPANVDGTFVADGAVNCNVITRLDMRLAEHPLTIEVAGGTAVDFHCADPVISEFVGLCFARDHGARVGELGFGTNAGIFEFVAANSHINERRPGIHLGFGQHNQSLAKVPYEADVHLDLITDGAVVTVDGDPRPVDLEDLEVRDVAHPPVRDDDITGDCCSFGSGELAAAACHAPVHR